MVVGVDARGFYVGVLFLIPKLVKGGMSGFRAAVPVVMLIWIHAAEIVIGLAIPGAIEGRVAALESPDPPIVRIGVLDSDGHVRIFENIPAPIEGGMVAARASDSSIMFKRFAIERIGIFLTVPYRVEPRVASLESADTAIVSTGVEALAATSGYSSTYQVASRHG